MEDRLQKFAVLIENGSFTKAAHELHLSQPALTLAITKLERELQTSLLIRAHRTLELTPAGELAYVAANKHDTINSNLRTELAELALRRPRVTVGIVDSVAALICAETQPLADLEANADVSMVVNNSRFLQRAIQNRKLDIALVVADDATQHAGMMSELIGTEPFVLVFRPDRFAAVTEAVARGKPLQFISYDQPSLTSHLILDALHGRGIKQQPTFYSSSPEVILRMVLLGKGVAALPYFQVRELLTAGDITLLTFDKKPFLIERPITVLKLPAKRLPAPLGAFAEQVRSVLAAVRAESQCI